jgi:hypothetical protein
VDDCTFWYTNEYYKATSTSGWATRIGAFKFTGSCVASSVATASFTARWTGKHSVTVGWRTASEVDLVGFNLYRADAKGRLTRLNKALIPGAHPGQAVGSKYAFVDRAAPRSQAVSYRLEAVSAKAGRSWAGAASVPVR